MCVCVCVCVCVVVQKGRTSLVAGSGTNWTWSKRETPCGMSSSSCFASFVTSNHGPPIFLKNSTSLSSPYDPSVRQEEWRECVCVCVIGRDRHSWWTRLSRFLSPSSLSPPRHLSLQLIEERNTWSRNSRLGFDSLASTILWVTPCACRKSARTEIDRLQPQPK